MSKILKKSPLRGRPPRVDREKIISVILKHKEKVLKSNMRPVLKLDPVWKAISSELDNFISDRTLYSFVADNKDGIKEKIVGNDYDMKSPQTRTSMANERDVLDDSTQENSSLNDMSNNSIAPETDSFTILLPRDKYLNLLIEKSGKRYEKNKNKTYERQYTSLKPGLWQDLVTKSLWDQKRIGCGFNFRVPKICKDGNTGSISGTCKCESTILINILGSDANDDFVKVDCHHTKGHGVCGKRYLRAPFRETVAKELCSKSVVVYRAEQADTLMGYGDSEPPHLYKASVLNVAKKEYMMSQFYDPDPRKSLAIMKCKELNHTIHSLGLDPFFAHYWTNHQTHVYRSFTRKHTATVSIDATGGIVKRLQRPDNSNSKHIFLYKVVINGDLGQFSVSQMLSESHDTIAITFWLMRWVKSGAPQPKEVICDSSKALLNAVVTAFAQHYTVEEYANACSEPVLPRCYVRIDVAHFIKMYANLLKGKAQRVRVMYLAAMGQLITACDLKRAEEVLRSILIIARSPTEGNLPCGTPTACETHKQLLRAYVTDEESSSSDEENSQSTALSQDENIFDAEHSNWWHSWGARIASGIEKVRHEEGDRDNAHYMPQFADRLLKDVRWLPLWSSVCRDKFGYGRVPASSAPVESDFNIIKTHLLKGCSTPMRADEFVEKHVTYLNGRMKIADAKGTEDTAVNNENQHSSDPYSECDNSANGISLTCSVCASGVSPTCSQECELCLKTVHGTIPCSIPVSTEEEANSRRRLCAACKDIDVKLILAAREEEDWGGLTRKLTKPTKSTRSTKPTQPMEPTEPTEPTKPTKPTELTKPTKPTKPTKLKKSSRYLQKNQAIIDTLLLPKSVQIPILKNGRNHILQAVRIGKVEVSVQYTCAFDSIVQVILATITDRPGLKCKLQTCDNVLFNLVLNIAEKGITAHTYRVRTNILLERHRNVTGGNDIPEEGNYLLDCRVNVGALATSLLNGTPSLTEISECSTAGCYTREKPLTVPTLEPQVLRDPDFVDVIKNHVVLKARPCNKTGCLGTVNTRIVKVGDLIFFEVFDLCEANTSVALRNFPRQLKNPLGVGMYELVGLVEFHHGRTRSSGGFVTLNSVPMESPAPLGHYTAACLRSSGSWFEYDDLQDKATVLPEKHAVVWHLLIYARE